MTIPTILKDHLARNDVDFKIVEHPQTFSASQTAQASHISGNQIAKAVVVKHKDGFMAAVLPAANHIWFDELKALTHREISMADEEEASQLFIDCETGAFPALADAYGLEVVYDESLIEQPDIYIESGDHTSLVHISGHQFQRLMENARHGRFSHHV